MFIFESSISYTVLYRFCGLFSIYTIEHPSFYIITVFQQMAVKFLVFQKQHIMSTTWQMKVNDLEERTPFSHLWVSERLFCKFLDSVITILVTFKLHKHFLCHKYYLKWSGKIEIESGCFISDHHYLDFMSTFIIKV